MKKQRKNKKASSHSRRTETEVPGTSKHNHASSNGSANGPKRKDGQANHADAAGTGPKLNATQFIQNIFDAYFEDNCLSKPKGDCHSLLIRSHTSTCAYF